MLVLGVVRLSLFAPIVALGGRGIGRFFLFRALFRLLGPVWGTVVLIAVLVGVGIGQQALQRRQR